MANAVRAASRNCLASNLSASRSGLISDPGQCSQASPAGSNRIRSTYHQTPYAPLVPVMRPPTRHQTYHHTPSLVTRSRHLLPRPTIQQAIHHPSPDPPPMIRLIHHQTDPITPITHPLYLSPGPIIHHQALPPIPYTYHQA